MSHRITVLKLGFISLMFFVATALFGASQYEEKVVIPKYNPNNPTHVLITPSNGKWNRYVLNDPNKKHFYVKPGKYSSKYINLTRSGTKSSRRTMSLYNGNDLHPAALPDNQVANVLFHFDGADYWTIDRMANLNRNVNPSMRFINGATHNIINQWHLRNFKYGAIIGPNCNYNTIQNSYINGATASALRTIDAIGLDIYTDVKGSVIGTKFINNDIRNATDGIQTTNQQHNLGKEDANFEGTIIDSNRIWRDSNSYTDRNGNPDPEGGYLYGENAINLKVGSDNPNNPMIITNNIMWGYSGIDLMSMSAPTPFVSQTSVKNVKMSDNIIAESLTGAVIMWSYNWVFERNIFYDISLEDPENKSRTTLYVSISNQLTLKNNTFINTSIKRQNSGWSLYFHPRAENNIFKNNIFINTPKSGGSTAGHTFDNNWFYNSKETLPDTNEYHFNTAAQAKMTDYTFTYERFTTHPKRKTLKGVITTKNSPHYGKAGAVLQPSTPPSNTIVYEDAEDGKTTGWEIYDKSPSGATISNFYDAQKRSFVIELDGQGINNGYRLGSAKAGTAFNNKKNTHIQWKMNYNESFIVYISVQTTKGFRYLDYTVSNTDKGLRISSKSKIHYIHHGLGVKVRNGTWQTVTRDLAKDIKDFEPDNDLLSVNGFLIRGSGKVDDIKMFGTKVSTPNIITYEDAQDGKINGWDIYDNTPAGARISNGYDAQKRSRVIELSGDITKNGYRFQVNNTKEKKLRWSMKYAERFTVYIGIRTTKGFRYLTYTDSNTDAGLNSSKTLIHHGLGRSASNGTWQTFTRDLQADLQEFDKGNTITSVNTFLIRGSGKIDDIQMSNRF